MKSFVCTWCVLRKVALLKLIYVISVNGLLRLSRLWLTINTHQNKLVQFLPSSAPASLYIYGIFKLNCVLYIICKRLTSISSDNRTLFIGLPQTNVIVNFIGKCFNTKQNFAAKVSAHYYLNHAFKVLHFLMINSSYLERRLLPLDNKFSWSEW